MLETLVLGLVAVWVWTIAVLVYAGSADRFLWVPVFLALTGVSAAILPLVMSSNIALVANAATLILFIASVQMFRPKLRLSITVMRQVIDEKRRANIIA